MAKILLEVEVDTAGGVQAVQTFKEQLEGVGVSGAKVTEALNKQQREYKSLMDRLEPARVAQEKLARQQGILNEAFQRGDLTADRYRAALQKLGDQGTKTHGGLVTLARDGVGQLTQAMAGLFAVGSIANWITEGAAGAMEESRALSQLSNVVKQFGQDGEAAAAAAEQLATNLARAGFDDAQTLQAVRDLTVQTHDYGQAISGAALAADMAARTGTTYQESLGLIQDLLAGKDRSVIRAHEEFGTVATTTQGVLRELESANRGYAATLNDTQAKLQAAKIEWENLWETIGGPLAQGATVGIQILKTVGNAVGAIVLYIKQGWGELFTLAKGAAAIWEAFDMKHPVESLKAGLADAAQIQKAYLVQVQGEWQGWLEDTTAIWQEATVEAKTYAPLISQPIEKAAKDAREIVLKESRRKDYKSLLEIVLLPPRDIDFPNIIQQRIDEVQPTITAEMEKLGQRTAQGLAAGLTDGILAMLSGKDFEDSWSGVWQSLWQISAQNFDTVLSGMLQGQSFRESMGGAGLYNAQTGQWNWGGIAQTGGGLMMAYGAQRQNQGVGMLGGAISGAAQGVAMGGGWIGAIVGAVVGAYMGYLSSQGPDATGYGVWFRPREDNQEGFRYGTYFHGGVGTAEEAERARQMMGVYNQTNASLRELARTLGVAAPDMSGFEFGREGESKNLSELWSTILKSEFPRAIFDEYRGALGIGLGQQGVSAGRIAQEMGSFDDMEFDKALAAFKRYVEALVSLRDLSVDLGKDMDTLREELTRTVRGSWLASMDDALDRVAELSEGLGELTSQEQVQRAEEIAQITRDQYQSNLQYLQQLFAVQEQLNQTFAETFIGFEETRMREKGDTYLSGFYQQQLAELQQQLAGATSPEQVQQITAQMLRFGQALWQMGTITDLVSGEQFDAREFVESYLSQQQDIANQLLTQWQDEVTQQNGLLLEALQGIQDALTSETLVRNDLLQEIDREVQERRRFIDELDEGNDSVLRFRRAIDSATEALEGLDSAGSYQRSA